MLQRTPACSFFASFTLFLGLLAQPLFAAYLGDVPAKDVPVCDLCPQIESAAASAESWLLARQNANGSFGPEDSLLPLRSALAVEALQSGGAAGETALAQGVAYLLGFPEHNTHFRSRRALTLAHAGRDVDSLLDSLPEFRNGGGMGAFAGYQSSLIDTGLAIEALALAEEEHLLDLAALLDYLQLHQGGDGGWGFMEDGPGDVFPTAHVLSALGEVDRLAVGAAVLSRARDFLLARQQADAGFGSLTETAVAYRALLAIGVDPASFPMGSPLENLLARQQADGSFDGDVYATAEALRVLRGQRPNLVITEVTATPTSVRPGDFVHLAITVRNVGPTPSAEAFFAVREGAPGGSDLAEAPLPALAAAAETTVEIDIDTTGFSGELELFATADSRGTIAEVSESDNHRSVRVPLRTRADLAVFVTDLALSPSTPAPDVPFRLLASVRNLGETEVALFGYRLDLIEGGVAVETLAAGEGGPAPAGGSVLLSPPLTLPEGEYTLALVLDPADLVDEENEANNRGTTAFFVLDSERADLALSVSDLVLTPSAPNPGETVAVDLVLRNLGNRPATTDLLLSEESAEGAREARTWNLQVPAGGSVRVQHSLPLSATAYALTAVADPADVVVEHDESNNRVSRLFRDLPDLAVGFDNLEITPLDPMVGDPVAVSVTVRNGGSLAASDVSLEVFAGDPDAGGTLIFSHVFPEIAAGGNRSVETIWNAEAGLTPLVAVVDGGKEIAEFSEENNRFAREVAAVSAVGPDLTVRVGDRSGLDQSPETLFLSGAVDLEIANLGDAPVDSPVLLRLFEDRDGDGRFGEGRDRVVALDTIAQAIAAGGEVSHTLALGGPLTFLHSRVLIEIDASDLVTERREDNNRAALFADCPPPAPPVAGVEPIEEWYLPGVEIEAVPIVVQLSDDNGDGRIDSRDTPDVVFHGVDEIGRGIFARSGLGGSELWTFRSSPAHPLVMQLGQMAAADLDGDGIVEVIGHRRDGRLLALEHDGTVKWVSDVVEGVGERSLSGPVVGDLDGDGAPEIAVGRAVLSHRGELIALGTGNHGRNENFYGPFGVALVPGTTDSSHSLIADIDLDGRAELIAGDTVYRLSGGALEVVWNRDVPDRLMSDGYTALGDFDADPQAEIVYTSSNQILIMNHDGSLAASRTEMSPLRPLSTPTYWGGAPTVADLDGDGSAEILVATSTELIAFRGNLSTFWRTEIGPDFGGLTGVSAFDLDGDGVREVLFLDETTFYLFDGANGSLLYSRPNTSKTGTELPIVADVDGDGRAEILLPSNVSFGGDASTQGLHVLGGPGWTGTRPIWNQYGYHGTNVLLDGTVPSRETPSWAASNTYRVNPERPAPAPVALNLSLSLARIGAAGPAGIPVTLRVGNGGAGVVDAGVVVALYADPARPPVAEIVLAEGLRPGAFLDVEMLWQDATAAGAPAVALVDPSDVLAECDEEDNRLDFILTETLLPDLLLSADGLSVPSQAEAGRVVPISAELLNAGAAIAPSSVLRLYLGDPALGAPVAAEARVPQIPPGGGAVVEAAWDTGALPLGPYTLHVRVDADEAIFESDEDNNQGIALIELTAPVGPDLDLADLTVVPASVTEGENVVFTATVANRGADLEGGFEVSFRVNGAEAGRASSPALLSAGESRAVGMTWSTLGRSGVLALQAVVDPDGVLAESDENNNRKSAELTVASGAYALRLSTERLVYSADQNVAIVLRATNSGAPTEASLEIRIVDAFGVPVAQLPPRVVTLPAGETALSFSWNTGSTFPGPYTLIGELVETARPETVRSRAVAGISIAAEIEASATLFAHRTRYAPHETALFEGAVSNKSANAGLTGVTARLAVADPTRAEVFAAVQTLGTLGPGASHPISGAWNLGDAAPGTYVASLSLRDGFGRLLAYASLALTVEDSSQTGAGLRGDLDLAPADLGAGAPLVASYQLTNTGNADLSAFDLRLTWLDPATQEIVGVRTARLDLARGASLPGVFTIDSTTIAPGRYLAVLTAALPAGTLRLDSRVFTVGRGVSIADAQRLEGDSGSAALRFEVRLSSPAESEVSVGWTTRDATAAAPSDYASASGVLTFAAGETVRHIDVDVRGDLEIEADEIFLVELIDPAGVLLGDARAYGLLLDEEGCASPDLLAGGDGEPLATADEISQEIDLTPYAASIDAGLASFALQAFVRAGDSIADPLASLADLRYEALAADGSPLASGEIVGGPRVAGLQVFAETIVPPVGTRSLRVTLTSEHGDALFVDRFSAVSLGERVLHLGDPTPAVLHEGNGGSRFAVFPISLSCPSADPVSVAFTTSDGTAVAGSDYEAAAGTLVFTPGESEKAVSVAVLGDTTDEDDETFRLTLYSPFDALLVRGAAEAVVLDDDGAVTLSVRDAAVAEGGAGADAELLFEVELSAPSGRSVGVSYAVAGGTAAAGTDFQAASGNLSFAPGETVRTVAVPVIGDELGEGDETLTLTLSNPQNAALADAVGKGVLLDDDPVEIRIDDRTVLEGDVGSADMVFTVSLSRRSARAVEVSYATADALDPDSATAGVDYGVVSGRLTLAPGVGTAEIRVPIHGDTQLESHESFLVLLSDPLHGVLSRPEGRGTIFDDDGVVLGASDVEVSEGSGQARVVIRLNRASAEPVSVDFATVDGVGGYPALAGRDYVAAQGTAVVPAGSLSAVIVIDLIDDGLENYDRTFSLVLADPVGAEIFDFDAEITLFDDDGWVRNSTTTSQLTNREQCIVLTVPGVRTSSAAWRREPLDLTRSFDKTFLVNFGDNPQGAAGMGFALQKTGLSANVDQGIFSRLSPMVGFEMYTGPGYYTHPAGDHISIAVNGATEQADVSYLPTNPDWLPFLADDPSVEDGRDHEVRVTWNAVDRHLTFYFDGEERLRYPRNVVADLFSGNPIVYYGMTGNTTNSTQSNLQTFCPLDRCAPGAIPNLSVADVRLVEGDQGTVKASFPVTLSCPSTETVTVEWRTEDGEAIAGEDYLPRSGSLSFAPGETVRHIEIDVLGDTRGEAHESFRLRLDAPVHAGLRHAEARARILSDDALFLLEERSIVEGDAVVEVPGGTLKRHVTNLFPVRLAGPVVRRSTIEYRAVPGSATAGTDYNPTISYTDSNAIVFDPGETINFFQMEVKTDFIDENDETFFLEPATMTYGTAASPRVEVTLLDDDAACLASPNLLRNGTFQFPVIGGSIPFWTALGGTWIYNENPFYSVDLSSLSLTTAWHAPVGELRQDVDLSSFAESIDQGEQDFRFNGLIRRSSNTAPARIDVELLDGAGNVVKTFDEVTAQSRATDEENRVVWVRTAQIVRAPIGTRSARVRLTSGNGEAIFDYLSLSALDIPTFIVGDATVTEGDAGTRDATFAVTLLCPSPRTETVDYLTGDGTAKAPADYEPRSGTLVFAPGETVKTVRVPVRGDTLDEGTETFTLHLGGATRPVTDAVGVGTILDDEVFITLTGLAAVEGDEGLTPMSFQVKLSRASGLEIRVDYATSDDVARADSDYLPLSGTLSFAPGETTKNITVNALGDTAEEPDECFTLSLSSPINAALSNASAQGCLRNDDLSVSIADGLAVEGGAGAAGRVLFEVTLSQASNAQVKVDYATSDVLALAGEDYVAKQGTLIFAPDTRRKTIAIDVIGDDLLEFTESFLVTLSNPVNVHLGIREADGLIVDDDDCQSVNMVLNGDASGDPIGGKPPHWTPVSGNWIQRFPAVDPALGTNDASGELIQDVDVTDFAQWIDGGIQRFLFEGSVFSSPSDSDRDFARIVVEYRDAAGVVLSVYDSGAIGNVSGEKQALGDVRVAPAGTRRIRIRLLSTRVGSYNTASFDDLTLRALATPTVSGDVYRLLHEEDLGVEVQDLTVRLSCAAASEVTVDYATADGTARAGADYLPASGTLVFAPGETEKTIPLSVVNDFLYEERETFTLSLTSGPNAPTLLSPVTQTIVDDDLVRTATVADVRVVEGDAGETTEAFFILRFSEPNGRPVDLEYLIGNGATAQAHTDFAYTGFVNVTIPANATTFAVPVTIFGDDLVEGDEYTTITLYHGTGFEPSEQKARMYILDDDDDGTCASVNLLANPSGDLADSRHTPLGWSEVSGEWAVTPNAYSTPWTSIAPRGEGTSAELVQEIDLTRFGGAVAAGASFRFEVLVRTPAERFETQPWPGHHVGDDARVVLEYLDAAGVVVDAFDTGTLNYGNGHGNFVPYADERTPPPAAVRARIRLLAQEAGGVSGLSTYFDGISLRSLGFPVIAVGEDRSVEESDPFPETEITLRLNCPLTQAVTVPYTVHGVGGATAGSDYAASAGTLTFAPGEIYKTVPVTILDDQDLDPDEGVEIRFDDAGIPPDLAVLHSPPGDAQGGDAQTPASSTVWIADDENVRVDLALCLDQSSSIRHEFSVQLDGTAAALEDPNLIPHDSTVRVSVYLFGNSTVMEVPPTIISGRTAPLLAEQVRSLPYCSNSLGCGTDTDSCVEMASRIMTQSPSLKQIVDISTDAEGVIRPAAREEAILRGLDAINFIGVGHEPDAETMAAMVYPQPEGGADGFYVMARTKEEYARVLGEKVRRETRPDLAVSLSDGLAEIEPGSPLSYTLTVRSIGSIVVDSLDVDLLLPSALTSVTVQASAGAYDASSGRWTGLLLDVDDTATLTISGIVDPSARGTLEASATVLPLLTSEDLDLGDNTAVDRTAVSAPTELALTKTAELTGDMNGDGIVNPGDLLTYTLTLSNLGSVAAQSITALDPLPAGAVLEAGSATATLGGIAEGDPLVWTLAELPGGQSATLSFRVEVIAEDEVVNQAVATAAGLDPILSDDPSLPGADDPTRTEVTAVPELRLEKTVSLVQDLDGDGVASPGDVLRYVQTVLSTGSAAVTGVTLHDLAPEHTTLVAGSVSTDTGTVLGEDPIEVDLGTLAAGASATVSFEAEIVSPLPLGVEEITSQATLLSDVLPAALSDDPALGGDADPTVILVHAAPRLVAELSDSLAVDADGDGLASPGDEIEYALVLSNLGNTAATGVLFVGAAPQNAAPVAGSLVTTGVVLAEDPVEIDFGLLEVGAPATASFRVRIDDPVPAGVAELIHQGIVAADGLLDVLTDDPDLAGEADPTKTPITATPSLTVEKTATLFTDPGGDGQASPGDELLYRIEVSSSGNTGVTDAALSDAIPSGTTVVRGSVQSSHGTVLSEDPVDVHFGDLAAGDVATVTFRVTIDDPFPIGSEEVSNQATATSAELDPVLSDDPATTEEGDATVTPIALTPEISIDDVAVSESAGAAVFSVVLSRPSTQPVTTSYQSLDGTALAGVDYASTSGILTFAPGETVRTLSVALLPDLLFESDEAFEMVLTDAIGGEIIDDRGLALIVDDEACPSPNLLTGGGGESEGLEGWTLVQGDWRRSTDVAEIGEASFFAGAAEVSEMVQDVDLSLFAERIAAGELEIAFGASLLTREETPPDVVRFVLEFRNAAGQVIDVYDSGELISLLAWSRHEHAQLVPAGTSGIRVGVAAQRFAGAEIDVHVDALELVALRTPALTVDDVLAAEGEDAVFTVSLSCAVEGEVSVNYQTLDGTALAGTDFLPAAGTLTIPSGAVDATIEVPVIDDGLSEAEESFFVELSGASGALLLDSSGVGTILGESFCAHSHGYWKTHVELWPVTSIVMGGVEYGVPEMLDFLNARGGDATLHLALQLVATKLNLASGSDPSIAAVVEASDAFLAIHPPGSNPRGEARQEADDLKNELDAYNNPPCQN